LQRERRNESVGEFAIGDKASGLLIPDLKIDVAEIMKLGDSAR